MEQHPDLAPAHARERLDQLEEAEQRAVAMEHVMVGQGVEVVVAVEGPGQAAQLGARLDDRDLLPARPGERVGGGHSRQASAENEDAASRHASAPAPGQPGLHWAP